MNAAKKLEKIMQGSKSIKLYKKDSEDNQIEVINSIEEPGTLEDILKIETYLQKKLPADYKEFLLQYNGARLFDYEQLDGMKLLGTADMCKVNDYAKATFEEDWDSNILIFAKYIGEDNYLGFYMDKGKNIIIDCFFEELPEDWEVISENFDEFLFKFIELQGHKFWLD